MIQSVDDRKDGEDRDRSLLSMRACPSTYVVFTVMFGGLALLALVGMVVRPSIWPAFVEPLAIILIGYAIFVIAISAFKVVVTETSITYRTLFSGSHSMLLSEIKKAKSCVGYNRGEDRNKPFIRLEITSIHREAKPLIINLKVFDRADISRLMEILNTEDARPRMFR